MVSRNPNGTGTYYSRLHRGKLRYCWMIHSNGKKHELSAKTQEELRKKVVAWQKWKESNVFSDVDTRYQKLSVFIDMYLSARKNSWKQRTYDGYKSLCENFLKKPPLGELKLNRIKPMMIESYLNSLVVKYSPNYISNIRRCLHTVLNYAIMQGYISINPCNYVKGPRLITQDIEVLTEKQILLLLNTARKNVYLMDKYIKENPAMVFQRHCFYYALFLTIYTGIRRGECYGLSWKNVDLDKKLIWIKQALIEDSTNKHITDPKTPSSIRKIAIPDFVVEELKKWKLEQAAYAANNRDTFKNTYNLVFPNTYGHLMNIGNVNRRYWNKLKAACDLPQDYRWHYLRHTHVSMLIKHNVPITEITRRLGHGNSAVTLKVYAHAFTNDESKAMAALEASWSGFEDDVLI